MLTLNFPYEIKERIPFSAISKPDIMATNANNTLAKASNFKENLRNMLMRNSVVDNAITATLFLGKLSQPLAGARLHAQKP